MLYTCIYIYIYFMLFSGEGSLLLPGEKPLTKHWQKKMQEAMDEVEASVPSCAAVSHLPNGLTHL